MRKLPLFAALVSLAACSDAQVPTQDGQEGGATSALQASAEGRYIVAFTDAERGRAALKSAGGEVLMDIYGTNAVAARLPTQALRGLQNSPHVEYIEEDAKRVPFAESKPYGISMVQADLLTQPSATARTVCIIDSGFYTGHEDLQQSNVTGLDSTGWTEDGCGHGTHVAGTIAALGGNGTGVVGVNPLGVKLYIVKVFGNDCGWTYASGLADAANKCVAAGANVINMSLGGATKSRTEESAFNNAWNKGVLSVAAAGNDGNNRMSYPASYPVVMSVAAIDENKQVASFSQFNREVDIAAPGVGVLSTVPWLETNTVTANGTTYSGTYITNAARTSGTTGTMADGGLCDTTNSGWSGKVVLCQRGSISFFDKVTNVKNSGGVAAVIYNNVSGGFSGTLGDGNSSTIPAIGISMEDGQALLASAIGTSSTVVSQVQKPASGYEAWNGTSMATPHVAGVAALVWAHKTTWSVSQIREALEKTAQDLGTAGRDDYYGHGLVQAKAALDYLRATYP